MSEQIDFSKLQVINENVMPDYEDNNRVINESSEENKKEDNNK